MHKRSFLTWLGSLSLLNLLPAKPALACSYGWGGLEIPMSQLQQVAHSRFQKFALRQYPQLHPDAIRIDNKEISIRVPEKPESGTLVPGTVSVTINDKKAYCKQLHIYGQAAGITLDQKEAIKSEQNNPDKEWSFLIASYRFDKECLPYCEIHFRHIGYAMYIGVVAEIEYFDEAEVGPRYLAAISKRITLPPCYFGTLASS